MALIIESPAKSNKFYRGTGLVLRCTTSPIVRTRACRSNGGITFEELNNVLQNWDEHAPYYKPVIPTRFTIPIPVDKYDDYLPCMVTKSEVKGDFSIIQLAKEIGENGVGEWIKYVLYNRHTERFILRSCVKYTAPDENSMLIASKSFGKCLPSHDPNWLVNETNLASDKEFWKQLKLNLAI
jgi:hypothetical protein